MHEPKSCGEEKKEHHAVRSKSFLLKTELLPYLSPSFSPDLLKMSSAEYLRAEAIFKANA